MQIATYYFQESEAPALVRVILRGNSSSGGSKLETCQWIRPRGLIMGGAGS